MWVLTSLLAGTAHFLQDNYSKKGLVSNKYSDWTVIFALFLYSLPVFILIWFFGGHELVVREPTKFIGVMIVLIFVEVIAQFFFHQAIKIGSLSLVKPFLSLTPIAIMPIAYFLRGEIPTLGAGFGVVLTAIGLYVLFSEQKENQNEVKNKKEAKFGPVGLIIITSILWAITTTLQKTGSELVGVTLFGLCYIGGLAIILFFYHLLKKIPIKQLFDRKEMKSLLPIGIFASVNYLFQYYSLTLANPAYVNTIGKLPTTFHLMVDKKVFKDKINGRRIFGNILSVIGAILIVLGA